MDEDAATLWSQQMDVDQKDDSDGEERSQRGEGVATLQDQLADDAKRLNRGRPRTSARGGAVQSLA